MNHRSLKPTSAVATRAMNSPKDCCHKPESIQKSYLRRLYRWFLLTKWYTNHLLGILRDSYKRQWKIFLEFGMITVEESGCTAINVKQMRCLLLFWENQELRFGTQFCRFTTATKLFVQTLIKFISMRGKEYVCSFMSFGGAFTYLKLFLVRIVTT